MKVRRSGASVRVERPLPSGIVYVPRAVRPDTVPLIVCGNVRPLPKSVEPFWMKEKVSPAGLSQRPAKRPPGQIGARLRSGSRLRCRLPDSAP